MSSSKKKNDENEVIDWEAALEQCAGDEEFLQELLQDLSMETSGHFQTIQKAVDSLTPEDTAGDEADAIRRAAHSIKGASANLMCNKLRDAAQFLEKTGMQGVSGEIEGESFIELVTEGLATLQSEVKAFEEELAERGINS
uniref:HPt domain-containing protein n=2 Tax=Heterosigma akashiwo TaxID=2829 RepID=A0A6V1QIJ8_HETAK|mmetsp:Transcript_19684/g.29835  ORF Transcript_19684/g.29835 Transcript_19684/m.29835 type:complete len:141 (+) Transcript_19684:193-615(+)|eukprot:CAMPEP_0194581470 /NCGR_PEP_ID=MMETSP0292-20121207/14924_1 /TAXON_ID=39354 /ORGANISM="Heterosigma akashiwo, Strain CCMP2393" /LENGTH=140 /DNA_ID=CAMNT_0039435229 /DNA_START=81 /DNA_END=503 /DNA_ORIENTATION=+